MNNAIDVPTERPILMNAKMVRAVLEGRKTHTRRIIKMKPSDWCKEIKGDCWSPNEIAEWRLQNGRWFGLMGWYTLAFADCPFGQVGDRLYVRETHIQKASGTIYRADFSAYEVDRLGGMYGGWKPSIHMPRCASRITLEIVRIRVERLNDISEADAKLEGTRNGCLPLYAGTTPESYRQSFAHLWESINDLDSWDTNPWVWVIEFEMVKP